MIYSFSLTILLTLVFTSSVHAETTNSAPLEIVVTGGGSRPYNPTFGFTPRKPEFSINRNTARCNANIQWNMFSYAEQAQFMHDAFVGILYIHQNQNNPNDMAYRISPRILTCKTFKETTFDYLMRSEQGSSGVGLGQVLDGTGEDVLDPDRLGFRSRLIGYEHISNYVEYKEKMANEIGLQLEMILAVLESKRLDKDLSGNDVKPILEKYYGNRDQKLNEAYAQDIFDCATCVKGSPNEAYTIECLCKTKPDDTTCTNIPKAPAPNCSGT